MRKLLSVTFIALLFAGCGEDGDVGGVRKSEELIGGQIFIVTKSRENVKLGLVSVKVFDKEGIKKIRSEAEAVLEKRLTQVGSSSSWVQFKEAWINETISRLTPSTEAKTDADGRFLFSSPGNEFMLAATSSRLAGDSEGVYQWLEIFQRDSIGPSGLLLSNDNLVNDLTLSALFPPDAKNRFGSVKSKRLEEWFRQSEERKRQSEADSADHGSGCVCIHCRRKKGGSAKRR